ncbi:DUF983 domain-containing protein [Streptoalloteichus hindustanus]|uniref:DUF983 domain-containing protein n=1 Tax=Streptoalloteichus hindustanus TaxID=2017 RepID=A0A1M4VAG6_STRHI|nr:DUF983 domain-containing protein [Streptoalloteichus hindustanus]SHE65981.1 hypothetical protein SAMN05444320_101703 [Streptoalloteichus hindustanus]
MTRLVRGADGRMWTVRTRMEWSNPATADDFEHDVSGGQAPGVIMAVLLGLLVVALVWWTPASVMVPAWLILALTLVVGFFPARWALRRPWTVVAETPGNLEDRPAERWVGQVRGVLRVRQEVSRIARNIEVFATPDRDGVGPLQPVE